MVPKPGVSVLKRGVIIEWPKVLFFSTAGSTGSPVAARLSAECVHVVFFIMGRKAEMDGSEIKTAQDGGDSPDMPAAPGASAAQSQVPAAPFGYYQRPALEMKFAMALERYPVVLAVAPNGYGKTATVAHALASSERPVAWVGIDSRMSTSRAFAQAFCSAVAGVAGSAAGLEAPEEIDVSDGRFQRLCAHAGEAIEAQCPNVAIVLDGYENVESEAVDAFVDYLMEYLPQTARLAILSSSRPNLAVNRMTLRGRLFELGTADFEFTPQEASGLFAQTPGLGLGYGDAERVNSQMDGWVAGLRLVEVELRSGSDLDTALKAGGAPQRDISQYLADDIVNRQPQDIRQFLLYTGVFESFCAELCDCALQREDSAQVIAQLLEQRLFVQQAGRPGWYRYARFFRSCLQDLSGTLPEDDLNGVRVRASRWLAAHGDTEAALEHAIEAGDFSQVSAVLTESFGQTMGNSGSARMYDLIEQLPESIVRKSRWANVSAAVACEMRQSFEQERAYAEAVLGDSAIAGPETLRNAAAGPSGSLGCDETGATLAASLHIVHMLRDYHQGRARDAVELGLGLLDGEREGEGALGRHGRCGVLNVMGIAYWYLGEVGQALACWQQSASLSIYVDWSYSTCLNLFGVAHAHYKCGRFESARETCNRVFAIANRKSEPVLSSGYAYLLMSKMGYDRNELDQAASLARQARRIAYAGKEQVLAMNAEMALARIGLARGNRSDAVSRANRCVSDFTANSLYRLSFGEASMLMSQIWLLDGKPDLAGGYLGRFLGFDAKAPFTRQEGRARLEADVYGMDFRTVWCEEPLLDYLYVLIQEGRTEGVDAWLDFIREDAASRGLGLLVMKALVMKALCAQREGNVSGALGYLAEALALGEPNGCVRTFADAGKPMAALLRQAKRSQMGSRFADEVLALLGEGDAPSAAGDGAGTVAASARTPFGEGFTPREREIMTLLCEGATNDEISKRLFLSLSTVKNHIHHVYTKLGVRNRAEAIVRIRELEAGD